MNTTRHSILHLSYNIKDNVFVEPDSGVGARKKIKHRQDTRRSVELVRSTQSQYLDGSDELKPYEGDRQRWELLVRNRATRY